MCRLSGVGETEDGAELQIQDEVKDEQGLLVHRARDIKLLQSAKRKPSQNFTLRFQLSVCPSSQKAESHREALGEVEAIDHGRRAAGRAVNGAEELRLVEAQLLQLLRVLGERGGKEQLLERRLTWRQTEKRRSVMRGHDVDVFTYNTTQSVPQRTTGPLTRQQFNSVLGRKAQAAAVHYLRKLD